MKRVIAFALILTANICAAQQGAGSIDTTALYNCWTDSREEYKSNDSVAIYRPCNFQVFPLSRFRLQVLLDKDGKCSWLDLAPDDAHYFVPGTWTYDKKLQLITIKDESGKTVFRYKLFALSKDKMLIAKVD